MTYGVSRLAILVLPLVLGCHDERPETHVYASPPPPASTTTTVSTATAVAQPDAPLGTTGPGARIVSVLDASTGAPATLTAITTPIDVMTLVALGPGAWAARARGVRSELVVKGAHDTVLASPLGEPPARLAAHAFRLERAALGVGQSSVRVRLVVDGGRTLVESAPIFLTVAR